MASDLASRQDESDLSKRRLIEQSKQFKQETPEEIRKVCAPLLRSFQNEIDQLSKRSKAAEAAFLSVYKKFVEMPDPQPALEQAVSWQKKAQRVSDLEIENLKLRETLDEYNTEFAEVKNQDVTIKALKERIRDFEESLADQVESKSSDAERSLAARFQQKEALFEEQKLKLAKQLGESEQQVDLLKRALGSTQTEMFELRTKFDNELSAKADELEIVTGDLERAQERTLSAEREAAKLKHELSLVDDQTQQSRDKYEDAIRESQLAAELSIKQNEIAQLVSEVQRLHATINKLRDNDSSEIATLEHSLAQKEQMIQDLNLRLESFRDYHELKKELRILKSLEFTTEQQATGPTTNEGKSLEELLVSKNRSLRTEITQLKLAHSHLTDQYAQLQTEYGEAVGRIEEEKQLVLQLEEDLRNISSLTRTDGEGQADPSTELLTGAVSPIMEPTSAADSLLPIVQNQRERFRSKAQELEVESLAHQQQMQLLQNEMDKLRSDNVKLYEKIKFLQSYNSGGGDRRGARHDDPENSYIGQYEQTLNPFQDFARKEKQRKYTNLKPYDKITLSFGRMIMESGMARSFCFFYTILLHLLVFLVLYKLAYTEVCKHDFAADCHQQFADHMLKVHGQHNTGKHFCHGDGIRTHWKCTE